MKGRTSLHVSSVYFLLLYVFRSFSGGTPGSGVALGALWFSWRKLSYVTVLTAGLSGPLWDSHHIIFSPTLYCQIINYFCQFDDSENVSPCFNLHFSDSWGRVSLHIYWPFGFSLLSVAWSDPLSAFQLDCFVFSFDMQKLFMFWILILCYLYAFQVYGLSLHFVYAFFRWTKVFNFNVGKLNLFLYGLCFLCFL